MTWSQSQRKRIQEHATESNVSFAFAAFDLWMNHVESDPPGSSRVLDTALGAHAKQGQRFMQEMVGSVVQLPLHHHALARSHALEFGVIVKITFAMRRAGRNSSQTPG